MKIFRADCEAIFISRPNRFIIHAELEGREVICHCPNTGRMGELLIPGVRLILEKSDNPNRKTPYSAVAVYKGDLIVPIVSARANSVAKSLILPRLYPGMDFRSEVTFGKSRFDFLLSDKDRKIYVEVKSCTLFEGDDAIFPDAPTTRGRKHLLELMDAVEEGHGGLVLFVIFNPGAKEFYPNSVTDPKFSDTLNSLVGSVDIVPYTVSARSDGSVDAIGKIPLTFK